MAGLSPTSVAQTPDEVGAANSGGLANQAAFEARLAKFQQVQEELAEQNFQFRKLEGEQKVLLSITKAQLG